MFLLFVDAIVCENVLRVIVLSALRAKAPKDDFCRLDDKAMRVGRLQTWSRPDRAVYVGGQTAAAADKVMVVIADPCLIASGMS